MDIRTFFSTPGKVLLTNRVGDINRLIRRWNLKDGMDTVDCRVLSLSSAARELVLAYAGLFEPERRYRVITPGMSTMILQTIIAGENLKSISEESKCAKTASEVLRALNQIRLNTATDAFRNGTGTKLCEMRLLLERYEAELVSKGYLDYPMLLQMASRDLGLIQERGGGLSTLTYCLPWIAGEIALDGALELTSVEKNFLELLECISGKSFLKDLVMTAPGESAASQDPARAPRNFHFFRSYGIDAEIGFVISKIRENRIPYGSVTLVYADAQYENMLRARLDLEGISYTFPRGYHAGTENYVRFMLDVIDFVNEDYAYESLEKLISNPVMTLKGAARSYRKVLDEGIGWGRERYLQFLDRFSVKVEDSWEDWRKEAAENLGHFVDFLRDLLAATAPELGCRQRYDALLSFANRYTSAADRARIALSQTLKAESRVFGMVEDGAGSEEKWKLITEYLEELMLSTLESTDAIAIYPYGSPLITDRDTLFVLGLSNENIAGTRAESPVFSDEELSRYATGKLVLAADYNAIRRRNFEETLAAFYGTDLYLGYSEYDTVSLLANSRSLLYADLLARESVQEADITKVGYELMQGRTRVNAEDFYAGYTETGGGEAVAAGVGDAAGTCAETAGGAAGIADAAAATAGGAAAPSDGIDSPAHLSASSLQTLLYCPLQYYYKKIRRIPDIQYPERTPDRWLAANQKGNLFHLTMEAYVNQALVEGSRTSLDEALLRTIFQANVEQAKAWQPCPSDAIFQDEVDEAYAAILRYAIGLHNELNASETGKKVLGCEARFENSPYHGGISLPGQEGEAPRNLTYEVSFTGSLDRVDGYLDGDTLCLEIIDYKTGNPERKQQEIEEGVQIQHYVYAICVRDWVRDHREELESRFGKAFQDVRITSMRYEFPFEEEITRIDVSDKVTDPGLKLPQDLEYVLSVAIGFMQHGQMELAKQFMDVYAAGKIENSEQVDYCRYCGYTGICRRHLSSLIGVQHEA